MWLAIIAAVVILAIIACLIIFLAGRPKANNGVVQDVNWQRSIAIEAIAPVTHDDWKNQIPADGVIGKAHNRSAVSNRRRLPIRPRYAVRLTKLTAATVRVKSYRTASTTSMMIIASTP